MSGLGQLAASFLESQSLFWSLKVQVDGESLHMEVAERGGQEGLGSRENMRR